MVLDSYQAHGHSKLMRFRIVHNLSKSKSDITLLVHNFNVIKHMVQPKCNVALTCTS